MDWTPHSAAELSQLMSENFGGSRLPLLPIGGGTALGQGEAVVPEAVRVHLNSLSRVIDYPARDLTVTVEAGVTVAQLQEVLGKERQQLAVDLPQARHATIGGAIATNSFGPASLGWGTLRDAVIGISAIDGQGRLFSAGGRVVKNVAGYDLCKLLIGSLGTLGIITQVTLKLQPQPESRAFVCAAVSPGDVEPVLNHLNVSSTRPVILELFNDVAVPHLSAGVESASSPDSRLCLGFAGSDAEVRWQVLQIQQELSQLPVRSIETIESQAAAEFWQQLTEFSVTVKSPLVFQLLVRPSQVATAMQRGSACGIALQAHAGTGVLMGLLSREVKSALEARDLILGLRHLAEGAGGRLTVLQCPDDWKPVVEVFGKGDSGQALMRGIKRTLDPAGILSPGRIRSLTRAEPGVHR